MMNMKQICCTTLLVSLGLGARLQAAEFEANTPYYEDDGWLDITEWFDGNDYNPTDEAWWRWDDEIYQASKDVGTDVDNDAWYGYTARNDDDWSYDYYDPYLYSYYDSGLDDLYEVSYRFYDYDKDGFYDAYGVYSDTDADGIYEDYDYYAFSQTGTDKQKQQAQKASTGTASRPQTVSGTVQKTKLVNVRGGQQHIVIALQPQPGQTSQRQTDQPQATQRQAQANQMLVADLGRAADLKNVNPKLGDKITVKGPRAQIGKQSVILARSFELNGKTQQVNRSPRTITAKVLDTKKTKIRGQEHLIAMVEASQEGQKHKIAVDLGPADRLKMNVSQGSNLTFSGFPVKVKDKRLLMAQSVQQGGQMVQINRQPTAMGGSAGAQKGQRTQDQKATSSGSSQPQQNQPPNRP